MRRFQTLILLLALCFYVWFLRRFGLGTVLSYVRLAGWGLALTIAFEAVARVANTLGWRVTIMDYPRKLGFGELFVARISGEAIDYVTPSAQLGGQFVMAIMVRRKLAMAFGLATVIVASLAEALGQIGFISGALMTALPFEARLHHLFWPMMGGLAIAIGLAAGIIFDATVIRALLVPALMRLFGSWNWWFPHSFARVLYVPAQSEPSKDLA